jgi:hypothetical protein
MGEPKKGDLRWLRDVATYEDRKGIYPKFTLQFYDGSEWKDVPEAKRVDGVVEK